MARNPRIKRLRKLITQRKARSQERAFLVEGPAVVAEAIDGDLLRRGLGVEAVYIEVGYEPALAERARRAGVAVWEVAPGVLGAALDTRAPQPVAAVIVGEAAEATDIGATGPLLVVIDPGDPGNLGTLIRSAEAAGAAGLVVAGAAVDVTNPKVVRATAGAALRFPVVVEPDVGAALALARDTGRRVLATVVGPDADPYDTVDLERAALVLGNEAHGLTPQVVADSDGAVTIPLAGPTESLNLAVAASVLCFEALRQRRSP
ncbi:MAG: RNA methyltransferase [Actinomycetota bacterium]